MKQIKVSAMRHERLTPPSGGMVKQMPQLTPDRMNSTMYVECYFCGAMFDRPASHVLRCETNYCSVSCRIEGRKVRHAKQCIICGAVMMLTPSDYKRIVTCSRMCKAKKRIKHGEEKWCFAYRDERKRLLNGASCVKCGEPATIIRGLRVHDYIADSSSAAAYCSSCHGTQCNQERWSASSNE